MPTLSMFYGLVVSMYFLDTAEHNSPHIHVRYQDFKAVFGIPDGNLLAGLLPPKKRKLVEAWIEIDLLPDEGRSSRQRRVADDLQRHSLDTAEVVGRTEDDTQV